MIEVRNLVKSFSGVRALDGLNLTVPAGSVYGLLGPNGAGKSTVIRHLAGIFTQDSGEVTIGGEPVFDNPAVKASLAYIPDEVYYYTQATVEDMLGFYAGIYPGFDVPGCRALLQELRLPPDKTLRTLSKGMQKQAAFATALSRNPKVVLLDEPVDGLDPIMRRKVWTLLLQQVAERGTTVLVSSHNLRELEDVCDRVGIMHHGKMLLERELSELQENLLKLQLALPAGRILPPALQSRILHESDVGSVKQLIVRGREQDIVPLLQPAEPLFLDILPLTLEEIFIYEIGGAGNALEGVLF